MVFPHRSLCLVFTTLLLLGLSSPAWAQQHFTNCITNSTDDATVVLPADASVSLGNGDNLSTGDEIALFSDDGQCAGAAVWDAEKTAVSISVADRDSVAGVTAGYERGETLKYRIWRASDDQVFEVSSASYTCSLPPCRTDGVYERDAVYELSGLDASSALPVELTDFAATRSGQSVVLKWNTASETNNSGFKVQHKTERSASWSTLSFVEGAGTTTQPQSYQYEAGDLPYGTHEFRLAQIDRDGTRNTTETVEVALSLDSGYEISKIYPNPIRQSGTVDVTVKESQSVVVRLYDILGREQRVLFDRTLPGDQTESIQLTPDRLPSGQYFLRVEGEDFQVTRRMTVVK
jgi:hypothetical protein